MTDFRTPALDLDNVYGRGPDYQPYMYQGHTFLLGDKIGGGSVVIQDHATQRQHQREPYPFGSALDIRCLCGGKR